MPAKVLTTGPTLTDEKVDEILTRYRPLDDPLLVVLRHLQAQITAQAARIEVLEAAA
ncbi:MAG TPA: hypothetical protein VNS19_23075 [Acidimicrobiales bacterium]|nr:hypothetical protein [Acidimicrobiales bacterium]